MGGEEEGFEDAWATWCQDGKQALKGPGDGPVKKEARSFVRPPLLITYCTMYDPRVHRHASCLLRNHAIS